MVKFIIILTALLMCQGNAVHFRNDRYVDLTRRGLFSIPPARFYGNKTLYGVILNENYFLGPTPNEPFLIQKHLSELYLEYCNFEFIDNVTFVSLPNLNRLVLSNNRIQTLSPTAFRANKKLEILELNDAQLRSFSMSAQNYLPRLKTLILSNNTGLGGHLDLRHGNSKLSTLECCNCGINEITENTFKYLTDLSVLSLQNNSLRKIDPSAFLENYALQTIDLSNNPIGLEIPQLPYVKELLHFICRDCLFTKITDKTFENLKRLVSIDLSSNQIHTVDVTSFIHTDDMVTINLNFNRLTTFDISTIDHLEHLKHLSLDGNAFTPSENYNTFKEYYIEKHLRDEGEPFREVKFENDEDYASLGLVLRDPLQQNHEMQLPLIGNRAESYKTILYLNVSYVDAHYFESRDFGSSEILQFSASKHLKFTPGRPFLYQRTLTHFVCFQCGIDQIYPETFSEMLNLKVIDLQGNKIRTIEQNSFPRLYMLSELWLNDNDIAVIDDDAIKDLSSIKILNLDGNRLFGFPLGKPFLMSDTLEEFSCIGCDTRDLNADTFSALSRLRKVNVDRHYEGYESTTWKPFSPPESSYYNYQSSTGRYDGSSRYPNYWDSYVSTESSTGGYEGSGGYYGSYRDYYSSTELPSNYWYRNYWDKFYATQSTTGRYKGSSTYPNYWDNYGRNSSSWYDNYWDNYENSTSDSINASTEYPYQDLVEFWLDRCMAVYLGITIGLIIAIICALVIYCCKPSKPKKVFTKLNEDDSNYLIEAAEPVFAVTTQRVV